MSDELYVVVEPRSWPYEKVLPGSAVFLILTWC